MKKEVKSSNLIKIICVSLLLIFLSGMGVIAIATQIENVKITLSNGYEMTVFTNKTSVKEILEENNIILEENEKVTPDINGNITENRTIIITDKSEKEIQVAKISESNIETTLEEILNNYSPIIEKIVVEQVEIPYETITKNVANGSTDTTNRVIKQGKNGIKEVTYKIKYQNEQEIERTVITENILQEPIDKIVQVQKKVTSRNTNTARATSGTSSGTAVYKVTAYCACSKCCGKYASGYTASGTKATAGRTVAASSKFSFGTKLSINGKTYVVEDRGGAITGNKIDIYMNSHAEALAWGVKYLPVEVVN